MKKIFAISVLSIMTVLSSNAWAGDISLKEAYGIGSAADYNIATVQFVEERANNLYDAIDDRVSKYNRDQRQKVVTTDANGYVQFSDAIEQGQVSGLTTALDGKVDDTQIANAAATVSTANMDTMVPTVQRMANAIADAVSTGVGAVDLTSRVAVDQGTDKANRVLVTGDDGKVTTATTITQAQVENLGTDLAAKFDKANVISDLTELPDGADGTEHVPSYAVYYMTNLFSNAVIAGEETLPFDATGGDAGTPIVTTLETPDRHSIIDGINSVYDVVKTNKTDIGNKVDKAQVIKADGTTTLAGTTVVAETLDKDTVAPTIANVEANFVPNAPTAFVDDSKGFEETNLVPGQYVMTVIVNSDGTKEYEWQAMELWSSSSTQYD